jgi:S-methylmethionine-dependent homocysteine/selenocysteine methylase
LPFVSRAAEIIGKRIFLKIDDSEFLLNFNNNIYSNYTNNYNMSKTGNPNEFLGQRKDLTPELMANFVKSFKDTGATILGGCCETRPSHIKEMAKFK